MDSIDDILNARFTLTDEERKKRRRRIAMRSYGEPSGPFLGEWIDPTPEPEPDPVLIQAAIGSEYLNVTGTRQALMGDVFVNETTL